MERPANWLTFRFGGVTLPYEDSDYKFEYDQSKSPEENRRRKEGEAKEIAFATYVMMGALFLGAIFYVQWIFR